MYHVTQDTRISWAQIWFYSLSRANFRLMTVHHYIITAWLVCAATAISVTDNEYILLLLLLLLLHNFTMFSCSSSHCPSARCVSAEHAIFKSTDIFRNSDLNINNLNRSLFLCFCLFCPVFVLLLRLFIFVVTVIDHWLLSSAPK
jgi:hypothetical protein